MITRKNILFDEIFLAIIKDERVEIIKIADSIKEKLIFFIFTNGL